MERNPLPRIAEVAAREGYAVHAPSEDHLELRDTWVVHSFFNLGWSTFHGNLDYRDGRVFGEFYLRSVGLGTLFLPQCLNLGPGPFGVLIKPSLNEQKDEILRWGEVPAASTSHGSFVSIDERVGRSAPATATPLATAQAPPPPRPTPPPASAPRPSSSPPPPPTPAPPPTRSAFCGKCGTRTTPGAAFCGGCGARVGR